MTENMIQFLAKVSENAELAEKLSNVTDRAVLTVAAKDLGIELTNADFETKPSELSDDDLDMVTGGTSVSCSCALGGGGSKDHNDKTCACVAAGFGYTKSGTRRCFCAVAGAGYDY